MTAEEWRREAAAIAARWEHGHDGLTSGCVLCEAEYAEVVVLVEQHRREERARLGLARGAP